MLWAPRNARVKSGYLCLNPFWAARLLKSYSPSSPSSSSSSSSTSSPPHRRSRSSGGRATGPQDLHRLVRGGRRREGCRRAHDRVLSTPEKAASEGSTGETNECGAVEAAASAVCANALPLWSPGTFGRGGARIPSSHDNRQLLLTAGFESTRRQVMSGLTTL